MKKLLFSLIIGSVLASALFLGCEFFAKPDVQETPPASTEDQDRKDVLALMHLQVPYISEDTLESYVMDFLKAPAGSGAERSVQSSQPVTITKTTKITHTVETGFAETTADQRSAEPPESGEIPFYVFTLEDQRSGQTGFALTCGDNRIGAVLAVVEQGNYDDDNPGLAVFYSGLGAYIEDTIGIYNTITQTDVENALKRVNVARYTGPDLPVTFEGNSAKFRSLDGKGDDDHLVWTKWNQTSPYNDYLNDVRDPPVKYQYVTGCGPTAMAQIMAYYKWPEKHGITSSEIGLGHKDVIFDWDGMVPDLSTGLTPDYNAIGELMYHLGAHSNSIYKLGAINENDNPKGLGGAETGAYEANVRKAFKDMGYNDPGSFNTYNYQNVKSSIDKKRLVMVSGWTGTKTVKRIQTPDGSGHYWVVDGYRRMETEAKNKGGGLCDTGSDCSTCSICAACAACSACTTCPVSTTCSTCAICSTCRTCNTYSTRNYDYVHCNMGWGGSCNGWFVEGVFDTSRDEKNKPKNIPIQDTRSAEDGNFKYHVNMLADITPDR